MPQVLFHGDARMSIEAPSAQILKVNIPAMVEETKIIDVLNNAVLMEKQCKYPK